MKLNVDQTTRHAIAHAHERFLAWIENSESFTRSLESDESIGELPSYRMGQFEGIEKRLLHVPRLFKGSIDAYIKVYIFAFCKQLVGSYRSEVQTGINTDIQKCNISAGKWVGDSDYVIQNLTFGKEGNTVTVNISGRTFRNRDCGSDFKLVTDPVDSLPKCHPFFPSSRMAFAFALMGVLLLLGLIGSIGSFWNKVSTKSESKRTEVINRGKEIRDVVRMGTPSLSLAGSMDSKKAFKIIDADTTIRPLRPIIERLATHDAAHKGIWKEKLVGKNDLDDEAGDLRDQLADLNEVVRKGKELPARLDSTSEILKAITNKSYRGDWNYRQWSKGDWSWDTLYGHLDVFKFFPEFAHLGGPKLDDINKRWLAATRTHSKAFSVGNEGSNLYLYHPGITQRTNEFGNREPILYTDGPKYNALTEEYIEALQATKVLLDPYIADVQKQLRQLKEELDTTTGSIAQKAKLNKTSLFDAEALFEKNWSLICAEWDKGILQIASNEARSAAFESIVSQVAGIGLELLLLVLCIIAVYIFNRFHINSKGRQALARLMEPISPGFLCLQGHRNFITNKEEHRLFFLNVMKCFAEAEQMVEALVIDEQD